MPPVRAYVALGSNLGDRQANLALARAGLAMLPGVAVRGASAVEETVPLGGLDQPAYLNQMLALDTTLSPRELLAACQRIEAQAGREHRARWASRTLDLDIVRYGALSLEEPGLTLPHPGLEHRDFWHRELAALERQEVSANAYILMVPMTEATSHSGIPSELRPTLPPWARVTPERIHHIQRVAELVASWGDRMGTPDSERNRWFKAVWLHDALRDADEAELFRWASSGHGPVELRHGPAAASRSKAEGETDRGVLDAVRYHSLGLAEWDMVGRVLYCADFLEPGRSFDRAERAELAKRFPADPKTVLLDVARRRLLHTIRSGWNLLEPTVRFWNTLADSAPSR